MIEYESQGRRTKYTIGGYSKGGAPGERVSTWPRNGQLSLPQARSITGNWKAARRAGHDPASEWEALLSQEREAVAATLAAQEAERAQPSLMEAVESFMAKIMSGKKSAPAIRYRLDRLTAIIGDKKIRDITRQDVIVALDKRFHTGCRYPFPQLSEAPLSSKPTSPTARNRPTTPRRQGRKVRSPPRRARRIPGNRRTNYWSNNMAHGWTPERRARQAALIRN